MKISIRLAKKSDLAKYIDLLQQTYQDAYTDEKLGLTKNLFSKEVFSSPRIIKYLKSNLSINSLRKTWLAFLESDLIGSITISCNARECELKGFYVKTKYQGRGIGKRLWKFALDFVNRQDIVRDVVLDIYAHNTKSIDIYKKWGFKIDRDKGTFYRHWSEWPKEIKAKCVYMKLGNKKKF